MNFIWKSIQHLHHELLTCEACLPDDRSQYPSPEFFSLMNGDNDTSSIRVLQNDVAASLPGKGEARFFKHFYCCFSLHRI